MAEQHLAAVFPKPNEDRLLRSPRATTGLDALALSRAFELTHSPVQQIKIICEE